MSSFRPRRRSSATVLVAHLQIFRNPTHLYSCVRRRTHFSRQHPASATVNITTPPSPTLGARCSSTAQHNRVDDNTISTQNNSKELPLSAFYAYALLLVWISTKGADAAQPSRSRTLMRTQQTREAVLERALL